MPGKKTLRVFLVDDEEMLVSVLTRFLERRGHIVRSAGSVEEALEKIEAGRVDAVVLDNNLPGRVGLAAIPEIAAKAKAPVLMITGYPYEGLETDAEALGAAAILFKPFDPPALEAKLQELVR